MSSMWCFQIFPRDCFHEFLEYLGLEGRLGDPLAQQGLKPGCSGNHFEHPQPLLENCSCLKSFKGKSNHLSNWSYPIFHLTLWALMLKLHTLKNSLSLLLSTPFREVAAGPLLCLEVTEFWVYKFLCTFHCSLNNHNRIFWKAIRGTWEMSSETIMPLNTGLITCIEDIIRTSVHYTECQLGINIKIKKKILLLGLLIRIAISTGWIRFELTLNGD